MDLFVIVGINRAARLLRGFCDLSYSSKGSDTGSDPEIARHTTSLTWTVDPKAVEASPVSRSNRPTCQRISHCPQRSPNHSLPFRGFGVDFRGELDDTVLGGCSKCVHLGPPEIPIRGIVRPAGSTRPFLGD